MNKQGDDLGSREASLLWKLKVNMGQKTLSSLTQDLQRKSKNYVCHT